MTMSDAEPRQLSGHSKHSLQVDPAGAGNCEMCFTQKHLSQVFSFAVEHPQWPTEHRPCPQRVHRSVTVKDCWQISHQPSSLGA
jgi:hypothetical protein